MVGACDSGQWTSYQQPGPVPIPVDINNPDHHRKIQYRRLPHRLRHARHHPAVAGGGILFGHSRIYTQPAFGYRGPGFGWSAMPDQFVLDSVRRRELENRRRPLFIENRPG